ncbi:MAG: uncharacterized protein A8A55_0178 [Amphiamblys sp. WSBS2006]|nr:MAG: uncharacterized protein A8A55_0166 [Amphiamblys sp. WSBS2006]OIR59041.1 MAG: uncharacterized protein A8A55_0178 [Amphiamblys sp. WSBS2006]
MYGNFLYCVLLAAVNCKNIPGNKDPKVAFVEALERAVRPESVFGAVKATPGEEMKRKIEEKGLELEDIGKHKKFEKAFIDVLIDAAIHKDPWKKIDAKELEEVKKELGMKIAPHPENPKTKPGNTPQPRKIPQPEQKKPEEKDHKAPEPKKVEEKDHKSPEQKKVEEKDHKAPEPKKAEEKDHKAPEPKKAEEKDHKSPEQKKVEEKDHKAPEPKKPEEKDHKAPEQKKAEEKDHKAPEPKKAEEKDHKTPEQETPEEKGHKAPTKTEQNKPEGKKPGISLTEVIKKHNKSKLIEKIGRIHDYIVYEAVEKNEILPILGRRLILEPNKLPSDKEKIELSNMLAELSCENEEGPQL